MSIITLLLVLLTIIGVIIIGALLVKFIVSNDLTLRESHTEETTLTTEEKENIKLLEELFNREKREVKPEPVAQKKSSQRSRRSKAKKNNV